ncbi:MAG: hypothetical protein B7Z62_07780 [Deltaproteobacteria bacterium 37-65-8]|nr:MAG: hypothetical protein B7Z62_07780 [Deltaproteobacteria bacterium 37-65-8]
MTNPPTTGRLIERRRNAGYRRTAGIGAEQAAAIAVEISRDRKEEERHPPEAVGTAIGGGNANGLGRSTIPVDETGGEQ